MKKLLATMLALAMLLGALPALAESGAADIGFEGSSYHLVYESAEIVDGELNVKISGYGSTVPLRNGLPVILAQAGASFGDDKQHNIQMEHTYLVFCFQNWAALYCFL